MQLLPDGEAPVGWDRIDAEPLTDANVERLIAASLSSGRVLGQPEADAFRISLAGAQEKTALLFHRGKWCRPLGATPTTHILKLPLGLVGHMQMDMKDSVENEWLCARLMQAFGLNTASCEIAEFGARKVLAVERFDRARQLGGWIARLPQEDSCQALGLPSSLKYQSDIGVVDRYKFETSLDGVHWAAQVASGGFGNIRNNPVLQKVNFAPGEARFLRFTALHGVDDNGWIGAAEITVLPAAAE